MGAAAPAAGRRRLRGRVGRSWIRVLRNWRCRAAGGWTATESAPRPRCRRSNLAAADRSSHAPLHRARSSERRSRGPGNGRRRRREPALPGALATLASLSSPPTASGSSPSSASSDSASWLAFRPCLSPTAWARTGRKAHRFARDEDARGVTSRHPASELAEELEFPEPIANEQTLKRALAALLDRLLARPERAGRAPRQLALSARLVGGGSWRRALTLREATADPERLGLVLTPKLNEVPAPALTLRLELGELKDSVGTQAELVAPRGSRLRERLREGLRQVRAAAGLDAVCTIVEVAPWSRVPESRAILVPRDD